MKFLKTLAPLAVFLSVFCGCTFYRGSGETDGLRVHYSKLKKDAFVSSYDFDYGSDNTEINIPQKYGKYKVKHLGGYYGSGCPSPFQVCINGLHELYPDCRAYSCDLDTFYWHEFEDVNAVYCDFTLNLNSEIKDDIYSIMDHVTVYETQPVTVFVTRVYVNCPEDNKYFYSENGKLYDKETGTIAEGFLYHDFKLLKNINDMPY